MRTDEDTASAEQLLVMSTRIPPESMRIATDWGRAPIPISLQRLNANAAKKFRSGRNHLPGQGFFPEPRGEPGPTQGLGSLGLNNERT